MRIWIEGKALIDLAPICFINCRDLLKTTEEMPFEEIVGKGEHDGNLENINLANNNFSIVQMVQYYGA